MASVCPAGHLSDTDDWCDDCGLRIPAPPSPVGTGQATGASGAGRAAGAPVIAGGNDASTRRETCPVCGYPRAGERRCRACDHDFVTGSGPTAVSAVPLRLRDRSPLAAGPAGMGPLRPPTTARRAAGAPAPAQDSRPSHDAAPPQNQTPSQNPVPSQDSALSQDPTPPQDPAARDAGTPPPSDVPTPYGTAAERDTTDADSPSRENGASPQPGSPRHWTAQVRPNRAFFDRGDDDGTAVFPADLSPRTIDLLGHRALVGRYSRSQRISPEIDLSAPPRDPGVSRSHALIEQRSDGSLAVTDLGSSNGTWIGPDAANLTRLEPGVVTPLQPGVHLYLGSWTRITVHRP